MKRCFLLVLLAACCLILTACYTEVDPWPEDNLSSMPTTAPTATVVPATAIPPTPTPTVPQFTEQPAYTPEPLPEDAVDVSPNLNG